MDDSVHNLIVDSSPDASHVVQLNCRFVPVSAGSCCLATVAGSCWLHPAHTCGGWAFGRLGLTLLVTGWW